MRSPVYMDICKHCDSVCEYVVCVNAVVLKRASCCSIVSYPDPALCEGKGLVTLRGGRTRFSGYVTFTRILE